MYKNIYTFLIMLFIHTISNANLNECASAPGQHKLSVLFSVPRHSQAALSLDKVKR